jgi:DNA polymerase-3 subunit alpha
VIFTSLHSHTTISVGDGYRLPKVHVERVASLGMSALALTEHGNVSSWAALEQAAKIHGIQAIYGIEAYVGLPKVQPKTHMILLAMNSVGLQNINRIVTQSWKQFYYSPTVYWEDLVRWNEGIIALSGCADSALSCTLLGGKYFGDKTDQSSDEQLQRAYRGVRRFQKVFSDRYYLEVQRFPGLPRTCTLNPILAQLSSDTGVSLVATADVHYPYPEQNAMQRILHASHRGKDIETADAGWEYDILLTYPESDKEIFKDLKGTGLSALEAKSAVETTAEIAERCKGLLLPKAPPPKYKVPQGFTAKQFLKANITEGWKYRIKTNEYMQEHISEYKERMHHEFETICAREGFADYFLIVADLVTWAKGQGIAVGPGRGSAAGSLVCYLLRITEIDSMQFPMLFERFLDPTRTDPPDIDIDFEDERRDEVFTYAATKYGSDRVANIATFTRYLGRKSLDDVARVYHVPAWKVSAIKDKLLDRPEGHPRFSYSLEDTRDTFNEVAEIIKETPELGYSILLEGDIREFSVHAAGMVVSSVPMHEICATYEREINGLVRQAIPYDKRDAAYLNLLKIDMLSLITMGKIAKVCKLAGLKLEDLYRIPLDDKDTLAAFRTGDVMGIFQFEGITTRRILKAVGPTKFMHLADVNALSRPGADDKTYITNKNTGLEPEYIHHIMAQHLSWTYGVVVYEEQILMILRDLGGFEPKELNRMRKIIHDKLGGTQFNEYRDRFIKGAAAHSLSEKQARTIWDGMVSASGYAFNIAHSVSYAHIGYWQQWLKIHYPAEFYTAELSKVSDDVRRGKFIKEAKRHEIEVLPPDILHSQREWSLVRAGGNKTIIAGFDCIEGIGPKTADNIIAWRNEIYSNQLDWEDLVEVKGIGDKTIKKIVAFVESDDPFGILADERKLQAARRASPITPTHISIDIPKDRELVCYIGIARRKKYYDAVESLQKKKDITREEALEEIENPHQLQYAAIDLEDEFGETVKVWVWRKTFPKFAYEINQLKVNSDVVVVKGYSSDFSGISIGANEIYVLKGY